jgi:hypothetical protein
VIPSPGGVQWGPRYLFIAAPLLAVATAGLALAPDLPLSARLVVTLVLIVSASTQVSGVRFMRAAKMQNAALTDTIRANTSDGEPVISEVYWVTEVAATIAQTRRLLYIRTAAQFSDAAARAISAGCRSFMLVVDPNLRYRLPSSIQRDGRGTCVAGERIPLPAGGVFMRRYSCD